MSIILKISSKLILQIMLLLSILLVIRGHNHPGGGFIGGLIGCSAIALNNLAFEQEDRFFHTQAKTIIIIGIALLAICFMLPCFYQKPFLTAIWWQWNWLNDTIKIGTPLIFDFGIYFLVLGSIATIFDTLESHQ